MSQVATVLVKEYKETAGETAQGRKWIRHAIQDGNGDWYSTFEAGVAKPDMKGKSVEVEYEVDGNFKNLLRATPVEEPPKPGTGDYVKGKEAPETQRAIHASVALENAVAWCTASDEARATLSEHGVLKVAFLFYGFLRDRAEGKAPPTPTSPSSDEIGELPV